MGLASLGGLAAVRVICNDRYWPQAITRLTCRRRSAGPNSGSQLAQVGNIGIYEEEVFHLARYVVADSNDKVPLETGMKPAQVPSNHFQFPEPIETFRSGVRQS